MKHISFEIFPNKNFNEQINFIKYLKKKNPKFITITCGKNDNFELIKKISYIKKKYNINIIPHIICDSIYNLSIKIINFIKLGIFDFIIISGDENRFKSFDFIKSIRILFGHIVKIFSGIYLEEHKLTKNIQNEIIFIFEKNKIGINCFISQFFYLNNTIYYYINNLKKIGINKNIILGIFPKKNIKEILFFINKCKIECPIWIIKNFNLINFKNYYFQNFKKIKHFHFYTFNKKKFVEYYLK